MSTRCKPGDLAIIMYDVPQCTANIGRVVEISSPAEYDRHGRLTWLIQPVTPEPYLINTNHDDSVRVMGYPEPGIQHPDEWMTPVQQRSAPDRTAEIRALRPSIH
jgi:hypothetical protein